MALGSYPTQSLADARKARDIAKLKKADGAFLNKVAGYLFLVPKEYTESLATPEAFLLTPDEVRARTHRGEANGKVSYWLQPQAYEVATFKERWERLAAVPTT